jgi:hypothetical protein
MKFNQESPFLTLGLSRPEPMGPKLPKRIAEWKLEPELAGPIPRAILLRRDAYLARFVRHVVISSILALLSAVLLRLAIAAEQLALILILIMCILAPIWFLLREARLSRALVERGTATVGVVVERKRLRDPKGRFDDEWRHVFVYETAARPHRIVSYAHSRLQNALTVLYLPESPQRAKLYKDCLYKAVRC